MPTIQMPTTEKPIVVTLESEEVQMIVQLLERTPATNKHTIELKHQLAGKLLPHLPSDTPK